MHRGFGGVWFDRAEHPGRVGQSSHGGAKKRHFPFVQRLLGGELAGGAISGGDDKPGRHGELLGAKCFGKLDLQQGYWQMPLAPEAQEVFTIVAPDGLFNPTHVPQGELNATSYFQGV